LVDGIDAAQEKGQRGDMPKENDFKINRKPINDRLNHAQTLRDHQDAPAIESIGNGAAEGANEKARHGIEKTYQAELKSRMAEVPNEPALRDTLHEIAGR
jgi:hypothetical protein